MKLFKNVSQFVYSKTKGSIDGSTPNKAIVRSSTSSLKWERKLILQTLKTLSVHVFVTYMMATQIEFLDTGERFGDLAKFQNSLNKVSFVGDFIFGVYLELLQYASKIFKPRDDDIYEGKSTPVDSLKNELPHYVAKQQWSKLCLILLILLM